jgi:hypothetical protein
MIPASHARATLLASILLALPDLGFITYELCRSTIQPDTIRSWVEWCDSRERYDLLHVKSGERDANQDSSGGYGGIGNYINGSLASAMGLSGGLSGTGSGSISPSDKSVKAGAAWSVPAANVQRDDWVGRLRADV